MSDNWRKCFLNVLSNNVACTKENGNAMDMLEDEKKKKMDMLGAGEGQKSQNSM